MNAKERMESVLGVRLTESQSEQIRKYYSQFYERPEDFVRDNLISIIIDDIGLKIPTKLMDICNMATGMDMRKSDTHDSLAWGKMRDCPVYAFRVSSSEADKLEAEMVSIGTVGYNDNQEMYAVRLYRVDEDYDAIAIVMRRCDVDVTGDLVIPGYKLVASAVVSPQPGYVGVLSTYYVPFNNVNNGMVPVMWVDHSGASYTWDDNTLPNIADTYQDVKVGVVDDDIKEMFTNLKGTYPNDDSGVAAYVGLGYHGNHIIYRRNHMAYAGNVASAKAMVPFLSLCMMETENVQTSLHEVLSGKLEWADLFFKQGSVQSDVTQETKESVHPAVGPMNATSDRGDGNRRSPIGKLFDNASSDYRQV